MTSTLRPAREFRLSTLADLFTRGFEGYFVPIEDSAETLAIRLRCDSIDLSLSRVALIDDRPVGLVYVAVRGWECRIAGMGVVKEARRRGVGRVLMEEAIRSCREAGLRRMILEVIEQNQPAVALYRGLGFEVDRRLVGYERPAVEARPDASARRDAEALVEIDPRDLGRQVAAEADPDLPWQLDGQTLGARSEAVSVHSLEAKAFAMVTDPGTGPLLLEALLVRRGNRRSGWGRRLFAALVHYYGERPWRIPARVPEELAPEFFSAVGFERLSLSQWEMSRPL